MLRLIFFCLNYCSAVVDVPSGTLAMSVCTVLSAAVDAVDAVAVALCAVVAVSGAESERTALI